MIEEEDDPSKYAIDKVYQVDIPLGIIVYKVKMIY